MAEAEQSTWMWFGDVGIVPFWSTILFFSMRCTRPRRTMFLIFCKAASSKGLTVAP